MLPHVVLTHVTTLSSKSTDSFIMNLLHTNTQFVTLRTLVKGFATQTLQFVTLKSPLKDLDHQL